MSRFSDYDDFEGEPEQILAMGRWQRNSRAVLRSKRGRKALAELREALMALPEHKLIEGAVCTVGAEQRKAAHMAEAEADAAREYEYAARYAAEHPDDAWAQRSVARPFEPDTQSAEELDRHVNRDGEGVCAVGAYAWYRKVKAGMDPAEAFASLPDLADEGSDALGETADLGEGVGLAYTLAWELAYRNDETFGNCTPVERHARFIAWIDKQLAQSAGAA
jgi:hypothetical protein